MSDRNDIIEKMRIAWNQPERLKIFNGFFSYFLSKPSDADLKDLEKIVIFIGSQRSGSTIGGCLLDAHPDIVIATELNLVHQITNKLSKEQLAKLMVYSSETFKKRGASWTGYSYDIPELYQGTYKKLRILGDKKANSSAHLLAQYPERIEQVEKIFGVPLRMIQIVRHPLDVIATLSAKSFSEREMAFSYYYKTNRDVSKLIALHPDKILTIHHEDLCSQPEHTLKQMTDFLDIQADANYYRSCAAIVSPSSQKSRERFDWAESELKSIRAHVAEHDFLSSYSDF